MKTQRSNTFSVLAGEGLPKTGRVASKKASVAKGLVKTDGPKTVSRSKVLPSEDDLWELPLKELRALCAERGLSTNHNREKIVARLVKWSKQKSRASRSFVIPDWYCPNKKCKAKKCYGSRPSCYRCNHPNPHWFACECGRVNYPTRRSCDRCGLLNPKMQVVDQKETTCLLSEFMPLKAKQKVVARKQYAKEVHQQRAEELRKRDLKRLEERRQKLVSEQQLSESVSSDGSDALSSVPSFSLYFEESRNDPQAYLKVGRTYFLARPAQVRKNASFWNRESPVIAKLEANTRVYVDKFEKVQYLKTERRVTRALIISPVRGWVSVHTKQGLMLRKTPLERRV